MLASAGSLGWVLYLPGGLVGSVDRINPAAEMLVEQIPEVLRFVGVEGRAMHKEAGRF